MTEINKQILIIGPDSQGGITSVINMYLNNGLEEVEFLASYKYESLIKNVFYYIGFLFIYFFKILNKNLKLVHIHSASRGSFLRKSICFYIAKIFGKKVIFHIHGAEFNIFYDKSPIFIKKLITLLLNNADLIIVLSNQWKQDISEKCSNKNIQVLYNPTVTKDVIKKKDSGKIKVLFMGRLGRRKGAYDIVEATKYISDDIEITLYGDGEIKQIQQLINNNNLSDKIKLGGWIKGDDVDRVYREANIYILPSYNEGLPMSVMEAMSYGLPIISTSVGGTSEAVIEEENGFLIQPGDYKSLAEKINFLAQNEYLREQFGRKSHEFSVQKFDIKVVIEDLRKFYDQLLS